MTLVLAGIDEAGYGPMLGPLCVAMAVFEVDGWSAGDAAPDLWDMLSPAVCTSPRDKRKRIAIDDSKKLKLANDVRTKHPLVHLERGVLAMLTAADKPCAHDGELFDRLGAAVGPAAWYAADPVEMPHACDGADLLLAANVLRHAMSGAGVRLVDVRCEVLHEGAFNDIVDRHGSKAAATGAAVARHLRRVRDAHAPRSTVEGGPRVVVDRQGGRTRYANSLARALGSSVEPPAGGRVQRADAEVRIVEEAPERSRYVVTCQHPDHGATDMSVVFQVEAERHQLPVALASMTAKLVRELFMRRFNAYWCGRLDGLRPTAGYAMDAKRWLNDAAPVLDADLRRALVRRA